MDNYVVLFKSIRRKETTEGLLITMLSLSCYSLNEVKIIVINKQEDLEKSINGGDPDWGFTWKVT
jgi:hypothetical protein